jgi:hypothetical protein
MSDWLGLGFIILLVLGVLFGLSRLGKPYEITQEEFDKRAKEAPGFLSVGAMGIQKYLNPATEKAAEVMEDLKQGYYEEEQESGDGNDTNPEVDNLNSSDKEESNA